MTEKCQHYFIEFILSATGKTSRTSDPEGIQQFPALGSIALPDSGIKSSKLTIKEDTQG